MIEASGISSAASYCHRWLEKPRSSSAAFGSDVPTPGQSSTTVAKIAQPVVRMLTTQTATIPPGILKGRGTCAWL